MFFDENNITAIPDCGTILSIIHDTPCSDVIK